MSWMEILAARLARPEPGLLEKMIPPLAGSFFGALAAFGLASAQRTWERRTKRYEALLEAQAVLLSHSELLITMGAPEAVEGTKGDYRGRRKVIVPPVKRELSFADLGFIASKTDPDLLLVLELAEGSIQYAYFLIELRNERIAAFEDDPETKYEQVPDDPDHVRSVSGNIRKEAELKDINPQVVTALRRAHQSNVRAIERLTALMKKLYPKKFTLKLVDRKIVSTATQP